MTQNLKNRNRSKYTFANINLLGKCNADCFFCLGKDIDDLLRKHDQTKVHFRDWVNFELFLLACAKNNITKIYITGQNTDSLCYKYLGEIIDYIQDRGFTVGLRTNAKLAIKKESIIRKCKDEIGYSINSLTKDGSKKILGWNSVPDFEKILSRKNDNTRVSIVACRENIGEIFDIIALAKKYNCRYVQIRRISTDTRFELLKDDIAAYYEFYDEIKSKYPLVRTFETAQIFDVDGIEVCLWETVSTTVNSINYFTDGTLSGEYFVVEGYCKHMGDNNE